MSGRSAGSAGSRDATGSRGTAFAARATFSTCAAGPDTRSTVAAGRASATRSTTMSARASSTAAGRSAVAGCSPGAGGPAAATGAVTTLPAAAAAASPSLAAPVATGAGSARTPVTRARHRPARARKPNCQSHQRQMKVSPHDHLMEQRTDHSVGHATLRDCCVSARSLSES